MTSNRMPLNYRIIRWIEQELKPILGLCGLIIVGGVGALSWSQWSDYENQKLYSKLNVFKVKLNLAIKEANKGEDFRNKETVLYKMFKKEVAQPIYSETMNQIALEYEQNINEVIGKKVTGIFAIDLADYFYQKKETQKAQNLLSSFIKNKKPKTFVQLAYMQLISYYIDQNKCNEALILLDKITNTKTAKPFHAEAFVQKGICYGELKQWGQAKKMYEKSLDLSDEPFHRRIVSNYLRILKFNQKQSL